MSDERLTRRGFLTHACTDVVAALGIVGESADGQARPIPLTGSVRGNERVYPTPAVDGVGMDAQASVILVRASGLVFAVSPACPHEQAAVRWIPRAERFQCSKHHSRYTREGRYISGRATRGLDRFPIHREGSSVLVDVTRVWRADTHPSEWASAVVPVP
jgi:nitrite reductase/ring-hydroxylating ferredoxin subunit